MKKSIISLLFALVIVCTGTIVTSCGGQKSEATEDEVAVAAYACPMHPEITGKETDTCSKCGMALEKVEEDPATEESHH